MNAADVLEVAADALFVHGRARGFGLHPDTGAMCTLGGLAYALGKNPDSTDCLVEAMYHPAGLALAAYLREHFFSGTFAATTKSPGVIHIWNDRTTTDDEEVLDTMRLVAKELRNAEAPS